MLENEPIRPVRAIQDRLHTRRRTRRYRSDSSWPHIAMIVAILAFILLSPAACSEMTDDQKAIDAAENLGFTDVEILDKNIVWWAFDDCDVKSDDAKFTMRGVNPAGDEVEFVVCAGVFKGGTVRSAG